MRQLTLGRLDLPVALVHVAVLVAFVVVGTGVALVTFRRALVK